MRHRQQVVRIVDDIERGPRDLLGKKGCNSLSGDPAAAARDQANGTFQRAQRLHRRIGEGHLEIKDDLSRAPADLRAQRFIHGIPGAAAGPIVDEAA